jgi:hypothetical protein
MLNNVPLSAYVLCYGPLALTIIGFIAFAAITDANARRTYLRQDPTLPAHEMPPVTKRVDARTPAGARVTIAPDEVAAESGKIS